MTLPIVYFDESGFVHHTHRPHEELQPNSLIIMDNAPVHNKTQIRKLLEEHGHTLLCLPIYSPDFNL